MKIWVVGSAFKYEGIFEQEYFENRPKWDDISESMKRWCETEENFNKALNDGVGTVNKYEDEIYVHSIDVISN